MARLKVSMTTRYVVDTHTLVTRDADITRLWLIPVIWQAVFLRTCVNLSESPMDKPRFILRPLILVFLSGRLGVTAQPAAAQRTVYPGRLG